MHESMQLRLKIYLWRMKRSQNLKWGYLYCLRLSLILQEISWLLPFTDRDMTNARAHLHMHAKCMGRVQLGIFTLLWKSSPLFQLLPGPLLHLLPAQSWKRLEEGRAIPTNSRIGRVGLPTITSCRAVEVGRGVCTWSLFWERLDQPNRTHP